MAEYTLDEVATHNTRNDIWIVIRGIVCDVTPFLAEHPGGDEILLEYAGTDATVAYEEVGHSSEADNMIANYKVGTLKPSVHEIIEHYDEPHVFDVIAPVEPPGSNRLQAVALALGIAVVSISTGYLIYQVVKSQSKK